MEHAIVRFLAVDKSPQSETVWEGYIYILRYQEYRTTEKDIKAHISAEVSEQPIDPHTFLITQKTVLHAPCPHNAEFCPECSIELWAKLKASLGSIPPWLENAGIDPTLTIFGQKFRPVTGIRKVGYFFAAETAQTEEKCVGLVQAQNPLAAKIIVADWVKTEMGEEIQPEIWLEPLGHLQCSHTDTFCPICTHQLWVVMRDHAAPVHIDVSRLEIPQGPIVGYQYA